MARKPSKALPPPRSEVLAFLEQIKADPDNDDLRLILADWLEDHSDPRGTFVRLQVESARLPPESEVRYRMEQEADELLAKHTNEWLSSVLELQSNRRFERGLLTLALTGEMLLHSRWKDIQESEIWPWVEEVKWLSHRSDGKKVADAIQRNLFEGITRLTLSGMALTKPWVKVLLRRSGLKSLRLLDVSNCGLGETRTVKGVVNSPALETLAELSLRGNNLGVWQVRIIAESPCLRNLQVLDLGENRVNNQALSALAGSPHLKQLKRLRLGYNQFSSAGVAGLVNSENFNSVEELDLSGLLLNDPIAQAMAEASQWRALKRLDLNFGSIGDNGAKALAQSANLQTLESLSLSENQIGDEGARAFVQSPHLDNLKHLDLTYNRIGWEGVEMLHERFGERVKVDSHWIA